MNEDPSHLPLRQLCVELKHGVPVFATGARCRVARSQGSLGAPIPDPETPKPVRGASPANPPQDPSDCRVGSADAAASRLEPPHVTPIATGLWPLLAATRPQPLPRTAHRRATSGWYWPGLGPRARRKRLNPKAKAAGAAPGARSARQHSRRTLAGPCSQNWVMLDAPPAVKSGLVLPSSRSAARALQKALEL